MIIAGLQPSVVAALPDIFGRWEGQGLAYPYTDSKGLVTVGTGNLIDPLSIALGVPGWVMPDGSKATADQISQDWARVKAAYPGVQSTKCAPLSSIRLSPEGRSNLILRTVAAMWGTTMHVFAGAGAFPADAQLALLSIDWAWGPGFCDVWNRLGGDFLGYGDAFKIQLQTPDFALAAGIMLDASKNEEKRNPGLAPRDQGTAMMLQNAQAVLEARADRSHLWYPSAFAT